jgi:ribonuclease P protein component
MLIAKCSMPSPRLRFPKAARLNRATDFARMRREGTSFHGRLMVLSVLRVEPAAPRFGLVTSRRVGGAVQRNRVRRRLREILRTAQRGIVQGVWLVLVARPAAAVAEFAELRADWMRLAQRSAILVPACS